MAEDRRDGARSMSGTDAVFDNSHWTDATGKWWRLEEMESRHQRNVLKFVRERALIYYAAHQIREELFDPYMPKETYVTEAEMARFLPIELEMGRHSENEAREWLEETPLVLRLKTLVDG